MGVLQLPSRSASRSNCCSASEGECAFCHIAGAKRDEGGHNSMQFLMKCHSRNRRIRDIGSVAWQGHGERKHSCTSTYLFNHRNHLDRGDHRMSREPQHHQSVRPCRHLERRPNPRVGANRHHRADILQLAETGASSRYARLKPSPSLRSQGTRGRERCSKSRGFPGFLLRPPLTTREKPRHTRTGISFASSGIMCMPHRHVPTRHRAA
jgi:hypothetical protein